MEQEYWIFSEQNILINVTASSIKSKLNQSSVTLWPLIQSYLFMVFIRKTSVVVDVTSYKLQSLIKNYKLCDYWLLYKTVYSRKGYDMERYQVILNKLLILGIAFFFPLQWILAIWLLTRALTIPKLSLIHFHCFRTCSWLSRTQITVLISWGGGGWAEWGGQRLRKDE